MKKDNEILDFLRRARRLSYIERCSNTIHIKPYSVAEHSFYIALYTMIFADLENERIGEEIYDVGSISNSSSNIKKTYDVFEAVRKALVHDLEESETGDILYPMRNMDSDLRDKINEVRDICVNKVVFSELPVNVRNYYIRLWSTSKDDSKEGILVAAMDKFEILMFAIDELDIGNKAFLKMYKDVKEILFQFTIPSLLSVLDKIESIYGK